MPAEIKRVAEVLADVDAMRITDGNPDPVGEYETEAEAILLRIRRALKDGRVVDRPAISTIVKEVFKHWFDQDIATVEAEEMARRIHELQVIAD